MSEPAKDTPKQRTYLDSESPPNEPKIKKDVPAKPQWWEEFKKNPPKKVPTWVDETYDK